MPETVCAQAGVKLGSAEAEPQRIYLKAAALTDAEAAATDSLHPDASWYDTLLSGSNVEVYKPDGSLLVKLCAASVAPDIGRDAFNLLHSAELQTSKNRKSAMGQTFKRPYIKRSDGRLSRTNQTCDPATGKTIEIHSSILGYFERVQRYFFCRQTAFIINQSERWAALQPYIKEVDRIYAQAHPERYAVQRAWAEATAQDFVIKGTAFTTITVNKSWATACHQDAGDLKQGFGVITCLRAGVYRGGYLVFPKWRLAVNLQSCDVLLFDPHEWHGNTKIVGAKDAYQRITCVFYYRKNMIMAGGAETEIKRAQNRKTGDPIWSDQERQRLAEFEARYPAS